MTQRCANTITTITTTIMHCRCRKIAVALFLFFFCDPLLYCILLGAPTVAIAAIFAFRPTNNSYNNNNNNNDNKNKCICVWMRTNCKRNRNAGGLASTFVCPWQVTHTPRTHCRCLSKHVLEQRVCGEINVLAAAAT